VYWFALRFRFSSFFIVFHRFSFSSFFVFSYELGIDPGSFSAPSRPQTSQISDSVVLPGLSNNSPVDDLISAWESLSPERFRSLVRDVLLLPQEQQVARLRRLQVGIARFGRVPSPPPPLSSSSSPTSSSSLFFLFFFFFLLLVFLFFLLFFLFFFFICFLFFFFFFDCFSPLLLLFFLPRLLPRLPFPPALFSLNLLLDCRTWMGSFLRNHFRVKSLDVWCVRCCSFLKNNRFPG